MGMESKTLSRIVRIALSDEEVQIRVSNLTLKNLLVLAWVFAGKNKKIQGALNLAKALKKTRDIRVFTMTPAQIQQFREEARQRKVLCSYVWDKSGGAKDINIDVIAFGIDDEDDLDQLRCTSSVTSGKFYNPKTSAELVKSFENSLNITKEVEGQIIPKH